MRSAVFFAFIALIAGALFIAPIVLLGPPAPSATPTLAPTPDATPDASSATATAEPTAAPTEEPSPSASATPDPSLLLVGDEPLHSGDVAGVRCAKSCAFLLTRDGVTRFGTAALVVSSAGTLLPGTAPARAADGLLRLSDEGSLVLASGDGELPLPLPDPALVGGSVSRLVPYAVACTGESCLLAVVRDGASGGETLLRYDGASGGWGIVADFADGAPVSAPRIDALAVRGPLVLFRPLVGPVRLSLDGGISWQSAAD